MSTLSFANVMDVNLVLKKRANKIKMKYSMHQYSNSYAYFRQLAHYSSQLSYSQPTFLCSPSLDTSANSIKVLNGPAVTKIP